MGIDVYLEFDGKEQIDLLGAIDAIRRGGGAESPLVSRWCEVNNSSGVYLRESYFLSPHYATKVFIPETFATEPFSAVPMTNEADWLPGIERLNGGIHYPWHVLAGRIEAVVEQAQLRYPDDPDYAQTHIDNFMAFVQKVRELEEADIGSWVVNSY